MIKRTKLKVKMVIYNMTRKSIGWLIDWLIDWSRTTSRAVIGCLWGSTPPRKYVAAAGSLTPSTWPEILPLSTFGLTGGSAIWVSGCISEVNNFRAGLPIGWQSTPIENKYYSNNIILRKYDKSVNWWLR